MCFNMNNVAESASWEMLKCVHAHVDVFQRVKSGKGFRVNERDLVIG